MDEICYQRAKEIEEQWHERKQYAVILKKLIVAQEKSYNQAKDSIKKNKIAHNLGYLIQVMLSLINSEKNIESRIKALEEMQKLR